MNIARRTRKLLLTVLILVMSISGAAVPSVSYAGDTVPAHTINVTLQDFTEPVIGSNLPTPYINQPTDADPDIGTGGIRNYTGNWQKGNQDDPDSFVDVSGTATPGDYRYCIKLTVRKSYYNLEETDISEFAFNVNGESWVPGIMENEDGVLLLCAYSPVFHISSAGGPLIFTDSDDLDIGQSTEGAYIMPFSVAGQVSGGTPFIDEADGSEYYVFTKVSGPDWIKVSERGEVSGAPQTEGSNSDLVIGVTDNADPAATAEITIAVAPTGPEVINKVAALAICCDPLLLDPVEEPSFTVYSDSEPAEFIVSEGGWEKYEGGEWTAVPDGMGTPFTSGQWRYHCVVRIDGEVGKLYKLAPNATVTVNGHRWTASDYVTDAGRHLSQLSVVSPVFTVEPIDLSEGDATFSWGTHYYTGEPITPAPAISYIFYEDQGPVTLDVEEGTDYTLAFTSNTDAGTARVTVSGTGDVLTGSTSSSFRIRQTDLSASYANASVEIENVSYTGTAQEPVPVITVNVSGVERELIPETDFTVSYSNNTGVGTATCTITGTGNYTGTIEKTFKIRLLAPEITKLTNLATGTEVKWTSVPQATHYYVYRKKSSETSWTKLAAVSGNSTTSYLDKTTQNPYKYTYMVKAYKGGSLSPESNNEIIYKVGAPAMTRCVNSAAGLINVKYTAVKYCTGYQVICATDNKFTKNKVTITTANPNTTDRSFRGLTKGKTYYVRARAYRKVNGVTYYSNWGTTKAIKITK
jgi:hypothetical protein